MNHEQIRQTLESEKTRLVGLRDDLRQSEELDTDERNESGGEISSVDNHPADVATEVMQREITLSSIEQIEAELEDVERAMRKLEDGTYGTSELSGQPIPEDRLEALPTARYTLEEQQQIEAEVNLNSTVDAPNSGAATL